MNDINAVAVIIHSIVIGEAKLNRQKLGGADMVNKKFLWLVVEHLALCLCYDAVADSNTMEGGLNPRSSKNGLAVEAIIACARVMLRPSVVMWPSSC